jgi:tetratricopeptide (TPR) repeat protein
MPEKALPYLMRAVELDALTNRNWIALNNDVAIIRKFKGRCSDGMQYHDSVFTINPAYADQWWAVSYNNMGLGYEFLGNQHLARENYMKAVSVDPSFDLAWYNLVLVAAHQNDTATTTEALKKLEALNPPLGQQAAMMVRR